MVKIRAYKPGDARKICEMLSTYTDYERDEAFWLWINRIFPDQPAIIAVAEDGDEIVGHYAILPIMINFDGKRVLGGLGIHAFIAPPARTKVPIFAVSKYCYALAKNAGIRFVWGFPNKNYRIIQEKVEKWCCVDVFNAYEKQLPEPTKFQGKGRLEEVSFSDPIAMLVVNELVEKVSALASIQTDATLQSWVRRYRMHPQVDYRLLIYKEQEEVLGVIVTKRYEDPTGGQVVGHVLEYRLVEDSTVVDLIQATENYFYGSGVRKSVLWPSNSEFRCGLDSLGYESTGFDTFFGVKLLDPEFKDDFEAFKDVRNWNLTMGMSDVF